MATINSINSNIPIEISKGATNATSMATAYGTIYYDTSGLATVASVGTSGQVLISNGSGSAPTFQTAGGGGVTTSSFLATLTSDKTNVTGDSSPTYYSVPFDTEVFDTGGDYNNTTGEFVAPTTGKYLFIVSIAMTDTTSWSSTGIGINTSNIGDILDRGSAKWSTNSREVSSEVGSTYEGYTSHVHASYVDMDTSDSCFGVAMATNSTAGSNTVDVVGDAEITYFSGSLIIG